MPPSIASRVAPVPAPIVASRRVSGPPPSFPPTPDQQPDQRPLGAPGAVSADKPSTAGAKQQALAAVMGTAYRLMVHLPWLNRWVGEVSGAIVKARFNPPADKPEGPSPAPLETATIESARQIMASHFKPREGKVVIGISGAGPETVHCFVVSGVKADGRVSITQALAQYGEVEAYRGVGGLVRRAMDRLMGNQAREMRGVVEEDWNEYARRSQRNSVVLLELDADPARVQAVLQELKGLVGRPYDRTLLAAAPATRASEAAMYCTEVSSWFINKLRPGTVRMSKVSGYPVFQVTDHMKATELHGGPLRVLYNGQGRLDVAALDPFPKDR
ncbi:MAG: hypothetical protein VKP62_11110 [Candidatus Sericytochromatia bacterium]|nr:hypothetical protein [Candidatus Sericytochromatia bacterium]